MDEALFEPLKAYKTKYAASFDEKAKETFDALVSASKMDVEGNRATVKALRRAVNAKENYQSKNRSFKILRGFLIAFIVISAVVGLIGIAPIVYGNAMTGGLMLAIGLLVAVALILVTVLAVSPKIKELSSLTDAMSQKADALTREAYEQMAPLNALFDSGAAKKLVQAVVPDIRLYDTFSMRRFDYLSGKYGYAVSLDEDRSTVSVLSGDVADNPFLVVRQKKFHMGSKTYAGSLVISWTTTYTDSDGHVHTQRHTQTLVATVTKPFPTYHYKTSVIYANDAADDLSFTHSPTHAESMSEDQFKRKLKGDMKQLDRMQRKAVKNNDSFTVLGNAEFDALFNATDRNDETQFRLMFTPLAQKNMFALMRDKSCYGDDFCMTKRGCVNHISPEHLESWDMDDTASRYRSFDVDRSRKTFMTFTAQYFKQLYFALAPVTSIPLYLQTKPSEYTYQPSYARNYPSVEAECAANALGEGAFKPTGSDTDCILKTRFLRKDGKADVVEVIAHSFAGEARVALVPVLGGDGMMHAVPVPWTEYIPISATKTMFLSDLGGSEKQFASSKERRTADENNASYAYSRGMMCAILAGAYSADQILSNAKDDALANEAVMPAKEAAADEVDEEAADTAVNEDAADKENEKAAEPANADNEAENSAEIDTCDEFYGKIEDMNADGNADTICAESDNTAEGNHADDDAENGEMEGGANDGEVEDNGKDDINDGDTD